MSFLSKPAVLCIFPDRNDWFSFSSICPFFSEPEAALDALRRSLDHFRRISGRGQKRNPLPGVEIGRCEGEPRPVSVGETFSYMEARGVPLGVRALARSRKEALEAAARIGYPVALKRIEPFVLHKTEACAVRLGIGNDEELKQAIDAMPGDAYLVQRMAPGGVDIIVGGRRDREFGPIVMVGLGGIFVEVFEDTVVRVAPVDRVMALEMIGEIKGAALLRGARGVTPSDVESLSKVIANVSRLLVEHPEIQNIDINPLRVFEHGAGCVALDVKMECC